MVPNALDKFFAAPEIRLRYAREAWWAVTDSNRRHSACKADALPTELTARTKLADIYRRGPSARKGKRKRDDLSKAVWACCYAHCAVHVSAKI
jgi:hypothetical protein